ncbi:MAG: hypothetical protein DHS20C19_13340 [Acidimicrobiales bacterium]|nr:MAG: hypothetical protein DHS20C19_13340 [Acidimicrobiales bacterium]
MHHPPPVTLDELQVLAVGEQPFVSIYVDMSPARRDSLVARIAAIADGLRELGAPSGIVEKTTTPFLAPPLDRSAMGLVASSDGRFVISTSPEPLHRDVGAYGRVPRLGPIIEWSQQMLTHAVVREDAHGRADIVVFGADGSTTARAGMSLRDDSADVGELLVRHQPHAVFVAGGDQERVKARLLDLVLAQRLPPSCHVEGLADEGDDALADAVVRHTASVVAERKVRLLAEFRFETSHGRAVGGVDDVVAAANAASIATLLANTDPDDHRRAAIRDDASIVPVDNAEPGVEIADSEVRLVDALIHSTLAKGGAPVIMPRTGEKGPADDLGAMLRPRDAQGLINRDT